MKCPICRKDVALGAPDFPFCSERCRLIDLGKWASEEYRISEPAPKGAGATPGAEPVEDPEDAE
jgi:endogenous inhibitor of DNA gyrase (YacG/DUF329 family)